MGRTEDKLQATKTTSSLNATAAAGFVGDTADEAAVSAALAQMNSTAPHKRSCQCQHRRTAPIAAQMLINMIMRINAKGTLLVFKHAARHMAQRGSGALCAI